MKKPEYETVTAPDFYIATGGNPFSLDDSFAIVAADHFRKSKMAFWADSINSVLWHF
jgi:hypothetical protein